jgi:hypothetical protein
VRTTLDIDTPVLEELKRLQRRQKAGRKSLGTLVSELLTEALARRQGEVSEGVGFEWVSKPMAALVDLDDKDALYAELDRRE